MNKMLIIIFIFYIGCTFGYVFEIFLRRAIHGKWINPGFLLGPYLPIYGFGLVVLSLIYLLFKDSDFNPIIIVLLMGFLMTLIEFIGGLIGLKNNVRLWDYSDRPGNYKGIICPLFSAIWTLMSALYYFFIASYIMRALDWFSENLAFSYTLGLFSGFIIIDFVYSTNLYNKIKTFAKENDFIVKYEQFKVHIKETQIMAKEKYSFLNPFRQTKSLKDYLIDYMNVKKKRFR